MESIVYNQDCMIGMSRYPDKYFDLAIVDPEYGIDAGNMQMGKGKNKLWVKKDWDKVRFKNWCFIEILRVSKNVIIWGGNYFDFLPITGGWIFWDKDRQKDISFSDGELAWTNFLNIIKKITVRYDGFIGSDGDKIHPTQKPVKLYRKILSQYASIGYKILDTHLGSGSSRIAAHDLGYDFTGFEIDKDYFEAAEKRYQNHIKQLKMF